MVLREMMALHPEMNLHQKVQRLQEMMLARAKSPLQKVLMRANPLQRLPQTDLLQEMGLLLATLLLREMRLLLEMRLLPEILHHLPALLLLMRQKLQHLLRLLLLSQQMQLHPHHHR